MLIHNIQSVSQYTQHLYIYIHTPGWWFQPSEKYEFVSWDDEIPNIYGNIKNVPNHQPVYIYIYTLYDIQFSIVKQNPTFVSTLAAGCFMTIVSHLPSLLASSDKKSMAGCQQPSSCIKGAIFLRGSLLVPMFCSWKLPNCSQSLWFFESTTVNVYIYMYIHTY